MTVRLIHRLSALAVASLLVAGATSRAAEPRSRDATEQEAAAVEDGFEFPTTDWPWWRGPQRNGHAAADQSVPLEWSETKNVAWKAEIPGRGHGSPTVVGERIFLATSDETSGSQSVLCFDRGSGQRLWQTEVHASGGMQKNVKSSNASSTVACDGERIFINFPNSQAVYTTALSLDGKVLWQTKVTDYQIHQGYGSSPALYQSLVLVSADTKAGGAIAALDRQSGEVVWKRERAEKPNYPSPIILHTAGRDQLLMTGTDLATSLDPRTGKTLWEIDGATTECVTSTVTIGELMFTSGGYPESHMSAIRTDGSGETLWRTNTRVYVPSLLAVDGVLFGVMDAGVAACWDPQTGEELWKERLGGTFTASPVLVGDKIFATNEAGETFIFRADPQKFELIGKNQLGNNEVFATPTFCGGRIYMRVSEREGDQNRQRLYCLAEQP
ncbi:outer membrane protein assembly factor BamB family protein [Candidatus Laterigemmans baculatus]|uniref:outer membrane protein assembly factor BamB family protein n=1 Tax=Candidatus Laterigemmans baculatus TaxID=2770505 RepID=UPI0013DA2C4F|nr:PQQ-binding-like beta-propeller repeat protein [Candidatus Laterigemmans baculatus]